MEHMDLLTFLVNALDQALVGLKRAGYSWDDGEFTALESDMEDPESFYYRRIAPRFCASSMRRCTGRAESQRRRHIG